MNLFGVTSPDGSFAVFHQLGSSVKTTVCVENCLKKLFPEGIFYCGLGFQYGRYLAFQNGGIGWFGVIHLGDITNEFKIERITPSDPRYQEAACIKCFDDFFGAGAVKEVMTQAKEVVEQPTPAASLEGFVPVRNKAGVIVAYQEV